MSREVVARVAALVEPMIIDAGLELVDVEYIKEGVHWYLRLYVDKEGGVDLDDCAKVSHLVGETLDKKDLIPQAYMLEVSSPGLERPLKKEADFQRYQGKLIKVLTKEVFQGYREFTGYLAGLENGIVVLEYQGEKAQIPLEKISRAQLEIEF